MYFNQRQRTTMSNTILITGSSRGIGRAIAIKLASLGYDIVVHCVRNISAAQDTCNEIEGLGQKARMLQFDVADRAATKAAIEQDIEAHGAYYGLVVNAGISADAAFPAMTENEWDSVISTNLDGFYNVVHPCVMPMVRTRKPARIVTLSSVSGLIGNRGQVNYSAAKAGIVGATKALALELAKRKITVNCVAPGFIETDMTSDIDQSRVKDMIPAQRAGTSEEVAAAVAFFVSEEASYVTRQVLAVNGGLC